MYSRKIVSFFILIFVFLVCANLVYAESVKSRSAIKGRVSISGISSGKSNTQQETKKLNNMEINLENCLNVYAECMDDKLQGLFEKFYDFMDDYQSMIVDYYTETDVPAFRCGFANSVKSDFLSYHYGVRTFLPTDTVYAGRDTIEYYKDLAKKVEDTAMGIFSVSNLDKDVFKDAGVDYPYDITILEQPSVPVRIAELNNEEYYIKSHKECVNIEKNSKFSGCEAFGPDIEKIYLIGSKDIKFLSIEQSCKDYKVYLNMALQEAKKKYNIILESNKTILKDRVEDYNKKYKSK